MNDPVAIARIAAERLSGTYGPQLQIELEKQIAAPEGKRTQYVGVAEAIAIAGLILSAAQFAHDFYKDQRDRRAADAESLSREIRVKLELPSQLSSKQRDQVIAAVVQDVISRSKL
jgi:hypothetical protein